MHRFEKWRHALLTASDTSGVVEILQEYKAALLPSDVSQFPIECQAILQDSDSALDIQAAAVTMLQSELTYEGPPEAAAILHEVAHTFVAAATRISQLRSRGEPLPKS